MNSAGRTVIIDRLELLIHPDNADQALVAGVQFARSLAGAEGGAFWLASWLKRRGGTVGGGCWAALVTLRPYHPLST